VGLSVKIYALQAGLVGAAIAASFATGGAAAIGLGYLGVGVTAASVTGAAALSGEGIVLSGAGTLGAAPSAAGWEMRRGSGKCEGGQESFLTSDPRADRFCPHGKTIARGGGRDRVPRPESGGRAGPHLSERRGLHGIREGAAPGP